MTARRRIFVFLVVLGVAAVFALNQTQLRGPMDTVLREDPRNHGIEVSTHYAFWVESSVLVYDLRGVTGEKSQLDVFRVLIQYAQKLKDEHFETVELAWRGDVRFLLPGSYFKKLGDEYGDQNPVYTLRTFPQNVLNLDGTPAFSTWEGGILSVAEKQMDDLSRFSKQWYLDDLAKLGGASESQGQ